MLRNRNENLISNINFFHLEFNVFYARDHPNDAINVAWNGGSATTYSFVNPNYRIYTVETETFVKFYSLFQ